MQIQILSGLAFSGDEHADAFAQAFSCGFFVWMCSLHALTEADSQVFHNSENSEKTFRLQDKCTIPCGGVGMITRERIPEYEIETTCTKCGFCDNFARAYKGSGGDKWTDKESCESTGCCKWTPGKLWGGYCQQANLGICTKTAGPAPDITKLSVDSGIMCKDLPSMGVSGAAAKAQDAGFELRDCDNPTDVCASYCVAIHPVRVCVFISAAPISKLKPCYSSTSSANEPRQERENCWNSLRWLLN